MFMLGKLIHFLPSYVQKTLYCSLVLPTLAIMNTDTCSSKLNKIIEFCEAVIISNKYDFLGHTVPPSKED